MILDCFSYLLSGVLDAQCSPNQPWEHDHRMTNKKGLSKRDICTKLIALALRQAGLYMQKKVREEVRFTNDCIYVESTVTTPGSCNLRASHALPSKSDSEASMASINA